MLWLSSGYKQPVRSNENIAKANKFIKSIIKLTHEIEIKYRIKTICTYTYVHNVKGARLYIVR